MNWQGLYPHHTSKGGASPLLQELRFDFCDADDTDMNAFAEILEGRAGIPGEARTRRGKRSFLFITSASSDANLMLRALLRSVKELPVLDWEKAFEACFCERQ